MIKKCLFPVAGYGTRFLPATKSMPKEMLPIVNKPLAIWCGGSNRSWHDHLCFRYRPRQALYRGPF